MDFKKFLSKHTKQPKGTRKQSCITHFNLLRLSFLTVNVHPNQFIASAFIYCINNAPITPPLSRCAFTSFPCSFIHVVCPWFFHLYILNRWLVFSWCISNGVKVSKCREHRNMDKVFSYYFSLIFVLPSMFFCDRKKCGATLISFAFMRPPECFFMRNFYFLVIEKNAARA